ncbi:TPA_exp: Uncharacterized protein A8136_0529 [Trichophyton benhamiae CBS 112371]|nr:TPA_exp: Uncharacterized protein A8136_0529 [Trichophyton benhamiae CBS 112371]
MSNSGLGPPGTGTYASNVLNVGDGTWDSQRNTFLLPNLMGLNFEAMRYNGMGNRFKNLPGYHSIIRAHGALAAITFLGLVPISILLARFYSRSPYWAIRLHIWMQILTLFLTTVVFTLGWFAVGPKRSLTNPHHGIGLAIYVMVIAQTFWGWVIHGRVKGKRRLHFSLELMQIHHWLGRSLALLGIAQIPLGLTLYGSPLSLFILFALAAFALLVTYIILSYLHERRVSAGYDPRGHYHGPEVIDDDERSHGNFGRLAAAGAAGAGLAMLGNQLRGGRGRSRITPYINEKESHHGGWGKKLLGVGALAGLMGLGKKAFNKRREDDYSESGYHPAHTVTDSYDDSISRVEEGRPPQPPPHRHQGQYHGAPSEDQTTSYTDTDYYNHTEDSRPGGGGGGGHPVRNALLGAGAFAAVKSFFGRKSREDRRVEQIRQEDLEHERIARANSKRKHQGDRRYDRPHSPSSELAASDAAPGPSGTAGRPPPPAASSVTDRPPSPGRKHRSHHRYPSTLGVGTAVAGAAETAGSGHRRRSGNRGEDAYDSPQVAITVKPEGRHVTLRQLTKEEKRAEREARRREHRRQGREGSFSEDEHWRRVEERERQQAQEELHPPSQSHAPSHSPVPAPAHSHVPSHSQVPESQLNPPHSPMPQSSAHPPGSVAAPSSIPAPPPPLPISHAGLHSPGTVSTDLSGSYASRSGRRRAERRIARSQRQHSVDWT